MARVIGLDIRPTHVRAAALVTSFRRIRVEQLLEVEAEQAGSLGAAITACLAAIGGQHDAIGVAVDGEKTFVHRLSLPPTAHKQLAEVLAYELEAQVPVDIDELVHDFIRLPRASSADPITVLVGAARTEQVRARIEQVRAAVGREPERVSCGALALANLAAVSRELAGRHPVAVVDLGGKQSELVILEGGQPAYARTVSRGVEGLPGSAPALAAALRQSLGGWLAQGGAPPERVVLVGAGATASGAEAYLSQQLEAPCAALAGLEFDALTPEHLEVLPRFAKSIALALGLSGRERDLDLRRGPLAFQRGYGFLKERMPVLAGLSVAVAVSFAFSTWAEAQGLERERVALTTALETLSGEALGEATADPDRVTELLEKARGADEADPLPGFDAFDLMVELSRAVPTGTVHDVEELDYQKSHLRLTGVVPSAADAQAVATALKTHRCLPDPKVGKITQVVNSERQKYTLELDVRCPEDGAKKAKGAPR